MKSLAISRSAVAPGAVGARVGIEMIFRALIHSVTRQPETHDETTSVQRLGVRLTKAICS